MGMARMGYTNIPRIALAILKSEKGPGLCFAFSSHFDAAGHSALNYNSTMPRLEGLGNIVAELRAERAHLVNNLRHVDAALAVLGKLEGGKFATVARRTLSAAARRKIATAQKARWAKVKSKQGKSK
jgi:hypothetical protein